ncbi:MAG: hypothetical protein KatS3mg009_1636 [Acidimicrobiia bacterium]|nr:MAG: hypothetical protein KatS3mg009_1636 [Acidimicrobiia bacterium]
MPASGTCTRRPDVAGVLAAAVAAGGLVLTAWALALVVVGDDAPAPGILSADDAVASGTVEGHPARGMEAQLVVGRSG